MRKCNATVAQQLSFDTKGKLQFREAMHVTYAKVGLYTDRPYAGLGNLLENLPHNLSHAYERVSVAARDPPEWLERKKERNSRFRPTNAAVARETKKRLTHINI